MKIKFTALLIFICSFSFGQVLIEPAPISSIVFDYDVAGNQISRTLIYVKTANPNNADNPDVTNQDYLTSDLYPEILYYPNPVRSELHVKWEDTREMDVEKIGLYDMNGKLYKSYEDQSALDKATINFENYPTGIYNLVLRYNNGSYKTLKIAKQ